jgi:hypothetical protein
VDQDSGTLVCTTFSYTPFGPCQPDGTMTRGLTGSNPPGCLDGEPELVADCTYVAPKIECTSFVYTGYGPCQTNNVQYRTVTSALPANCTGGSPVTAQGCTYVPPACTTFVYSNWSDCGNNNVRTRTIVSSLPAGCVGGNPSLSEACISCAGAGDLTRACGTGDALPSWSYTITKGDALNSVCAWLAVPGTTNCSTCQFNSGLNANQCAVSIGDWTLSLNPVTSLVYVHETTNLCQTGGEWTPSCK